MPPVSKSPFNTPLFDEREFAAAPAQPNDLRAEERYICDMLRLARLCPRTSCRRARRCLGHPVMCLDTLAAAIPQEAYDWAERVAQAREDGQPVAEIEAAFPGEALAWRGWIAGLDARLRRSGPA